MPDYNRALIPAASLDALRAERDADRLRYLQMSHERDAILDQLQAAEAKLAAVGALADELASAPPYARFRSQIAQELRTLIAEAGAGDNDNTEVTK